MTTVAGRPVRRRVFDGWIVVGATSIMLLVAGVMWSAGPVTAYRASLAG